METDEKTIELTPDFDNVEQIKSDKEQQHELSKAIMLSLEVEQAFKMYSYRIIGPEDFKARIKELTEFHLNSD